MIPNQDCQQTTVNCVRFIFRDYRRHMAARYHCTVRVKTYDSKAGVRKMSLSCKIVRYLEAEWVESEAGNA